jgi:hypothetical protein
MYDSSFATITSKNNKIIAERVCYLDFIFKPSFIVSFAPFFASGTQSQLNSEARPNLLGHLGFCSNFKFGPKNFIK